MRQICAYVLGMAFAFCMSPCAGVAQDGDIAVQTKATSNDIESWLDSGDPRLTAWAAYFSVRNSDPSGDATMVEILDRWVQASSQRDELSGAEQDAFVAILDALIQHNRSVSPETLAALAEKFPAQAAILAGRLSIDESLPLLQSWYGLRKNGKSPALARIAAMMLSKSPPPGFASSILRETREIVQVSVVDPGVGVGGGSGSCFGVGDGISPRPGWPAIYRYAIEENAQKPDESFLVAAGGDRITYWRTTDPVRPMSIRSLGDETRRHLLLEMLGGNRTALQWETFQQQSLEWTGPDDFVSDLRQIVDGETTKLRETVDEFVAQGLVAPDEAAKARPRLFVRVIDDRRNADLPLPDFEYSDLFTSVWIEPISGARR